MVSNTWRIAGLRPTICTGCCRRGIYFHPHHDWFLSAAHTEEDVRRTLEVTDQAFATVRRELPA
jgi:glutamate-1-semialdehyde aminotransferase